MKKSKLKLVTKILAIIIVCLISFFGIYVQEFNSMSNIVKDYKLGKDLSGYRQVVLEVSEEEEEEEEEEETEEDTETEEEIEETETEETTEDLTENYELAKSIIENRLKEMQDLDIYEETKNIDVLDYNISLNKSTGQIYLQIPENDSTDFVVSNISETATFEMADSEDGTVYLTNEHIKEASAVYSTTTSGTIVYLEIEFTKEGAEILKELSEGEYATIEEEEEEEEETEEDTETEEETEETETEETTEESEETEEETTDTEEEEEETQKEITLSISGSEIITTSFDTVMDGGVIDLSMNSASTDEDEIYEYLQSTDTIALLLNSGALPLTYEVTENQYVESDISVDILKNATIIIIAVIAILLIFMIIKNKLRGLLGALSFIGFVAVYLLIVRYTNITITLESIIGGILMVFINYIFTLTMLKLNTEDQKAYNKKYLQKIIKLIPALIVSIVFTFSSWTTLNSFGIMMFWGIILIVIYNRIITKNIVD